MICAPRSTAATASARLPPAALRPAGPERPRWSTCATCPSSPAVPAPPDPGSRRTSARLCATVLPKPNPGSMTMRSRAMPAASQAATRACRKAFTSATTSTYSGRRLHGPGLTLHVHEAHRAVGAAAASQRTRAPQTAHIVDQRRAGRRCGAHDLAGCWCPPKSRRARARPSCSTTGITRCSSSSTLTGAGAGPRGLAADIDDARRRPRSWPRRARARARGSRSGRRRRRNPA